MPTGATRRSTLKFRERAELLDFMLDVAQVTAETLNRLQFLTIRSYLSLVFATLVLLLMALAVRG